MRLVIAILNLSQRNLQSISMILILQLFLDSSENMVLTRTVLDEAVGQLGDVHEAVLMYAHVDEGAKVDDIAHRALELHAGLQVVDGKRRAAKDHLGRVVARIAAELLELVDDVDKR